MDTAPVPSTMLPVPLSGPVMLMTPVVALPRVAFNTTPLAPFKVMALLLPVFVAPLMVNAPLVVVRLMLPLGLVLPVVTVKLPAMVSVMNTESGNAVSPVKVPVFAVTTTLPAVTVMGRAEAPTAAVMVTEVLAIVVAMNLTVPVGPAFSTDAALVAAIEPWPDERLDGTVESVIVPPSPQVMLLMVTLLLFVPLPAA